MLLISSLLGCDDPSAHEHSEDAEFREGFEPSEAAYEIETSTRGAVASVGPTAQRYLALMPAGVSCPEVAGWSERPLFRLTTSARTAWDQWIQDGGDLPPILARFCVYTTESPPESAPNVPGSVRVDPDLAVVIPQAGPPPGVPQARANHFLAQLGAAPSGFVPSGPNPYLGDLDGLPYVAVVDTADSTPPGVAAPYSNPTTWPPAQRHGLTMAALIDTTRCPSAEPNCLARQYRVQAFPFDSAQAEPDPAVLGGQWASLGSLASALGEALVGWRSQPDSATAPLVLNLSVGWDPAHGTIPFNHEALLDPSNPDGTVPATVQAVYSALAWGSCQGVITVAASGNRRGGGCAETGPLAPASWESLPPVSASSCSTIAGPFASSSSVPALAHGAGGVLDAAGPIDNTRLGSLPARVLYAHQGTIAVGGGVTEALTGSSLAAAAFSSLVAVVHSHLPRSPERSVGDTIETIDNLGTPSSFDPAWLQPEVSNARQLAFDDVFSQAVGPSSPYQAAGGGRIDDAIANEISSHPQMVSNPTLVELDPDHAAPAACGPVVVTTALAPNTDVTPDAESATDELRPQPHVPICPTCPVLNNNRAAAIPGSSSPSFALYLRIATAYDPADISQATLSFVDRANSTGLRVTLPTNYVNVPLTVIDLTRTQLPDGTTVNDWLTSHPLANIGYLSFSVEDEAGPQPIRQVIDVIR